MAKLSHLESSKNKADQSEEKEIPLKSTKETRKSILKSTEEDEGEETDIIDAKTLRESRNYNYYILLPDDKFTFRWEITIIIVLLFTFTATPYRIAFVENEAIIWQVVDGIVDFIFLIDIFVNFFVAYYDGNYVLVDNRKEIA